MPSATLMPPSVVAPRNDHVGNPSSPKNPSLRAHSLAAQNQHKQAPGHCCRFWGSPLTAHTLSAVPSSPARVFGGGGRWCGGCGAEPLPAASGVRHEP